MQFALQAVIRVNEVQNFISQNDNSRMPVLLSMQLQLQRHRAFTIAVKSEESVFSNESNATLGPLYSKIEQSATEITMRCLSKVFYLAR